MAPAAELVRIVRSENGALAAGRAAAGRGAWLCARSPGCVDLAVRRKAFARAFRVPVDEAAVEALRAQL